MACFMKWINEIATASSWYFWFGVFRGTVLENAVDCWLSHESAYHLEKCVSCDMNHF